MRRAILRNRLNLISPKHQHYSDYLINYGIRQWLPALRKAVTTGEKIAIIFFTCVWYRQSAAHVTRLSLHSLMNERLDEWKSSPFSVRGRLSNVLGLWLLQHYKTLIAYRQWRSNFSIVWSTRVKLVWLRSGKVGFLALWISSVGISENSFQPP